MRIPFLAGSTIDTHEFSFAKATGALSTTSPTPRGSGKRRACAGSWRCRSPRSANSRASPISSNSARGADGEIAFPVEYKRGKPKRHRADEVQLCAQALCLEDMTGRAVPAGALFYAETKRRGRCSLRQRSESIDAFDHRSAPGRVRIAPDAAVRRSAQPLPRLLARSSYASPEVAGRAVRAWRRRMVEPLAGGRKRREEAARTPSTSPPKAQAFARTARISSPRWTAPNGRACRCTCWLVGAVWCHLHLARADRRLRGFWHHHRSARPGRAAFRPAWKGR